MVHYEQNEMVAISNSHRDSSRTQNNAHDIMLNENKQEMKLCPPRLRVFVHMNGEKRLI